MFSGIVETTSSVVRTEVGEGLLRLFIKTPKTFNDLKLGDSISVNGVCLTVEEFNPETMRFALGPETLKVTGWTAETVSNGVVNLERSLRLEDRIHGHLVTGHVDAMGTVLSLTRSGDTQQMSISIPPALRPLIWPKGSVAVNGVSLTINNADREAFTVGLIPETLKRTNLGCLKEGDGVCLEADNMARGLVHWARQQQETL